MPTPFDPSGLTPAQQKEVEDRQLATVRLNEIDDDLADAKAQLAHLLDLWFAFSQPLPFQPPTSPLIPTRESIAASYYKELTYFNALSNYRGEVLGWKRNAGQPNHPATLPQFVPPQG